jgi:ADP-ribose pyrophosphatase
MKLEDKMGKTEKVIRITNFKWLNLFEASYTHGDDKKGTWMFASRKENPTPGKITGDAVVIIPLVETDSGIKMGVVKEYRYPLGCYEWGFPAGLNEDKEHPELTATRELHEETGLEVEEILYVTNPGPSSAGMSDEAVNLVFIKAKGVISTSNLQDCEDIQAFLYSPQQIKSLLKDKEVAISAKAIPLFLMFVALEDKIYDFFKTFNE